MFRIPLNKFVQTDRDGYSSLINLYHEVISQSEREIVIDFSFCQRFDANLSSVLGAILDLLSEKGFIVYLDLDNVKTGVRKTLDRNGFLFTRGYKKEMADKETFIHYEIFAIADKNNFKTYINEELINKQRFPKHTELVGESICTSIFEIFVNATDHGNCNYVYCCGEYYPDKKPPKLDMTIVDCGETILNNVVRFHHEKNIDEYFDAAQAIEWAVKEGNTTKKTTGGLGLSLLMDFISLNKGSLHIVSSNGVLVYEKDETSPSLLDKPFPGTIVNMEFNFDDNNSYYMSHEKTDLNDLL